MEHFTSQIIHLDWHLPLQTYFTLTLYGREQLHFISIKSLENISLPIFAARSPLSSPSKLLNLWYDIGMIYIFIKYQYVNVIWFLIIFNFIFCMVMLLMYSRLSNFKITWCPHVSNSKKILFQNLRLVLHQQKESILNKMIILSDKMLAHSWSQVYNNLLY